MPRPDTLPPPPPLPELMARGPVALFLDFDGTLVEIAPEPDAILVPGGLADRLHRLRDRLDGRLALVSGRALDDLESHIGRCEIARAGSHGLHCLRADGTGAGDRPEALPQLVVSRLRAFAAARGLRYEAKTHGGALHFRASPAIEPELIRFAEALANEFGLEVKQGKAVVELVHPGASKAAAVRAFMAEQPFAGSLPIFVGDDVTDEDGFLGATECGGFGLAVGERISENARYHLATVARVYEWLEL